jgi:hypothetical protein
VRGRKPGGVKWDIGGVESRRPHVDRDRAVGFERRFDHAGTGPDADRASLGQALVVDEADETPRAVAALLDLAAIGIEDPIAEIDAGPVGRLDDQDLVGADAEAAIGQPADLAHIERERTIDAVDHHEVVAGPLHLGKAHSHGAHYRRDRAPRHGGQ